MTAADEPRKPPSSRLVNFVLELWDVLRRPSTVIGLGILVLGGFFAGVIFWGAFNTALELTNTEKFCVSCHEMRDNVYAELKSTIHFSNRSGVRATCPDCHVPHNWTNKIARKMQASNEVWGHLFGEIDTREEFLDHRLELAEHEWARLEANDSLECRNATVQIQWILQSNLRERWWLISASCSPVRRPASIAAKVRSSLA